MNANEVTNLVLTGLTGLIVLLNHYALKRAGNILTDAMGLIGRVEKTRDDAIELNGKLIALLDVKKMIEANQKQDAP